MNEQSIPTSNLPNEGRPCLQILELSDGTVEVKGSVKEEYQLFDLLRKAKEQILTAQKIHKVKGNGSMLRFVRGLHG